jgi:hypothetical protein
MLSHKLWAGWFQKPHHDERSEDGTHGKNDSAGGLGAVMKLTNQQSAYLRRVYGLCGPKHDRCADSRAVATTIGATEDERMDLEDALAQAGYIQAGPAPGTVVITERGWRAAH